MTRIHYAGIAALLAIFPAWLYAATITVAPAASGGSDTTGTGTTGAPYETIAHALAQAAAGDTVELRNGTYGGGLTIDKNGMTLRSAAGERGVIQAVVNDANIQNSLWVNATDATISGIDIIGGYYYALKFEQGSATVNNCRISGSGRDCVKIVPGADDITIADCEIFDSGLRDPSNAEGIDNVNGDRMAVQRCYIHDIATNGVYAKGGPFDCVIEQCLVANCGAAGIMLGQDTDDQFFDTVANPDYYENIDGIVRNCIVVNTAGAGIAARAALRPKFYNNTCVNVAETQNGGIYLASTPHPPGDVSNVNPEFINNIIVLSATSTRPAVFIASNGLSGTQWTINRNRYHDLGGACAFWNENSGPFQNYSFLQWQTNVNADANSSEGSPGLNSNYHLATGSQCIDAGATLGGVAIDYDGQARTTPYDIGADEATGGSSVQVPPPAGTIGTGASSTGASTLSISLSSFTDGTPGVAYTQNLTATGGPSIFYNWAVTAGSLPPGLNLSQPVSGQPGRVAGTPTAAGNYNITLQVTSGTETASGQFVIRILSATGPIGGGTGGTTAPSGGGGCVISGRTLSLATLALAGLLIGLFLARRSRA